MVANNSPFKVVTTRHCDTKLVYFLLITGGLSGGGSADGGGNMTGGTPLEGKKRCLNYSVV